MRLDDWAGQYNGTDPQACIVDQGHDTLYVLELPEVPGYVCINTTTKTVFYDSWPALVRDLGPDATVRPVSFHQET